MSPKIPNSLASQLQNSREKVRILLLREHVRPQGTTLFILEHDFGASQAAQARPIFPVFNFDGLDVNGSLQRYTHSAAASARGFVELVVILLQLVCAI